MSRRAGGARLLGGLLLCSLLAAGAAPLSWDLPEPRSRANKIRVQPRGNLWATGHFMGKKSLDPLSMSPLGSTPHISLGDQRQQLSHDLFRILQLKKALGMSVGSGGPHAQEAAGAHTAEMMQIMGQTQRHSFNCVLPGKVPNGTLIMAASGCRSRDRNSPTPLLFYVICVELLAQSLGALPAPELGYPSTPHPLNEDHAHRLGAGRTHSSRESRAFQEGSQAEVAGRK
ncbi:PREDICTED: uncharacterized protein LOC102829854 [Chrysochloris asiatica]|uniref:Uncharacterized protein LOC102829854 n=1 Tax=Chrysochloris asiatica TaxID=185453 RepID=A0A9B0TT25_CHRAS|nr:PREDICTED: uncharacterized protein LOC102829854 [Chrysochloris asiatica]